MDKAHAANESVITEWKYGAGYTAISCGVSPGDVGQVPLQQNANYFHILDIIAATKLYPVSPEDVGADYRLCKLCEAFVQHMGIPPEQIDDNVGIPFGDWLFLQHHSDGKELCTHAGFCSLCRLLYSEWCILQPDLPQGAYSLVTQREQRDRHREFGIFDLSNLSGADVTNMSPLEALRSLEPSMLYRSSRSVRNSLLKFRLLERHATSALSCRSDWQIPTAPCFNEILGVSRDDTLQPLVWCLKYHASCQRSASSQLPKRVIDIHSDTIMGRIILRETDGEIAPYVTLSHCWGGQIPNRLLTDSLSKYLEEIPYSKLPNLFVDVIYFLKRLGIRYLWIDAFCIIQDDPNDWKSECLNMAEIYSNCLFNICATESRHSSSHLQRGTPLMRFRVVSEREDSPPQPWGATISENLIDIIKSDKCPLNTRGWTLQERLLSPANLHFVRGGMVWECRTSCFDNHGHFLMPDPVLKCLELEKGNLAHIPIVSRARLFIWARLVENFSQRALTKHSDKLVALAGLVKWIQQQSPVPDTYLAGLWKGDLPISLIWVKSRDWLHLASPYRAPSWSWAAYDGAVSFPMSFGWAVAPNPTNLELLSVHIEETHHGSCGDVLDGNLVVNGLLRKLDVAEIQTCRPYFDRNQTPAQCWALYICDAGHDIDTDHELVPHSYFMLIEGGVHEDSFRRIGILRKEDVLQQIDLMSGAAKRQITLV